VLANGGTVCVGEDTLREAVRVARRIGAELAKLEDPEPYIRVSMSRLQLVQANPAIKAPAGIPTHDEHVVREGLTVKAGILTSDAQLFLRCVQTGVPVIWPLQLVRRLQGLGIGNTFFGVRARPERGFVLAKVHPGAWADGVPGGRFSIVGFENDALWLYYHGQERAWVAEVAGLPEPLKIAAEVAEGEQTTVAVSWAFGQRIQLRVGSVQHPAEAALPQPLLRGTAGARILAHRTGQHAWSGTAHAMVDDDRPLGRTAWANGLKHVDLTPNPFDHDRLRTALSNALRFDLIA